MDHDKRYTVSPRASYTYKDITVYAYLLYGSGLRSGFANTDELPGYYPFNLGFTHLFHLPAKYGSLKFRFDVTNVFDQSYQLRNGTGIGVFAPQFGPRRGFFGGMSWVFDANPDIHPGRNVETWRHRSSVRINTGWKPMLH
jgi:hypothetical protein